MEFPEAGRVSAKKFLEYFLAKQKLPSAVDDPLPVNPNWPTITCNEVEAEIMDISRTLLSSCSCPGLLNYNITKEVTARVMKTVQDTCQEPVNTASESDDNPLLNGKQVVLLTAQTVHQVCNEWVKDLPKLVCSKQRPEFYVYAAKNARRKMEDRHSLCVDLNTLYGIEDCNESQSFFGIFDGHAGVEAASYSSVHVHHNIVRHPTFTTDPVQSIKEGIKVTDERVCAKDIKSGSTAVVSIIRGNEVYVGWVGDSQAMLVRDHQPVEIMTPHKPGNEEEQARIEAAGGMVIYIGTWRVNGNLSVSRAIGDAKDKKYVIGEAEVTKIDLDGSEDYLVLACDGVWDVVNGEELVGCVNKHFQSGGEKANTAKAIVDFAISEGSGDNLSCIVVFFSTFKPPQSTVKPSETT